MDCPQKQKSAHYKRDKLMDKKRPTNQVSPRLVALNNYEPKTAHYDKNQAFSMVMGIYIEFGSFWGELKSGVCA